jgi:cell division protein FtsN
VKANAERMRDKLAAIGTIHISPATVRGGVLYRVRLGPFPERKFADHTLERAAKAGVTGARIISN